MTRLMGPLLALVAWSATRRATAASGTAAASADAVSAPGGAGHALLLADTPVTLNPFQAMPAEELTFEAWVNTEDLCNRGTLLSYSVPPPDDADGAEERSRYYNAFVVFNHRHLIGEFPRPRGPRSPPGARPPAPLPGSRGGAARPTPARSVPRLRVHRARPGRRVQVLLLRLRQGPVHRPVG